MKPQEFFFNLRDFLAIFLPGVFVLYAMLIINEGDLSLQRILDKPLSKSMPGVLTLVFAAAAYGVGSMIYFIGSRLDHFHQLFERILTPKRQLRKFDRFNDAATTLRKEAICKLFGENSELHEDWSNKSFLLDYMKLACPDASSDLERLEATQKIFRSFSIVSLLLMINLIYVSELTAAVVSLAVAVACAIAYGYARSECNYRLLKWVVIAQVARPLSVSFRTD